MSPSCYAVNNTFLISSFQDSQLFSLARVYKHTSVLGTEVYPNMLRKKSKVFPEGNCSVPPQEEFGSDQTTLKDVYLTIEELSNKSDRELDDLTENLKRENQCLASLEQDARQPSLAMDADVPADKKTRGRTEGATTALQATRGDIFSESQVNPDPKRSTHFGDDFAGLTALPHSGDDALVDNGAAAPKSCISPLEMRAPTVAGGLLPAGTISTATRTPFDQPPIWFFPNEEKSSRTSIPYASYYIIFGWIDRQQASFWPRVIETNSGQNLVFDPGESTGRLLPNPFLRTWRTLLCRKVFR